jgi:zinc D-Ala-D-Ala carboxypeptidase
MTTGAGIRLSDHFLLSELLFSETALRIGIDNTPNEQQIDNLGLVANYLLEPARLLLNSPLHVVSGYRSPAVNAAVGGDKESHHMLGLAADFKPIGFPLADAFDILRLSSAMQYDKIIFECNAWIHVALPIDGQPYRRQALRATGGPGDWKYVLVENPGRTK